ncbi:hypothetical protein I2I05_00495 [Hymenobacter sp. BT683]|uniref:Uncharacterized protein n=1 Tax=Hymenobacter jeongseonensis TaxID=2791027 RepID=A0ABS0IBY1_9BACT|nr:hypothetical protein [Hymenobacter jeongseonensis]MBF9235863.1 hypothetical protein [Hymenobacter jeongseonensis]
MLTWVLAGALLLSVGANLYWLTPPYRSERPDVAALRTAWDDDDEEEDDASWAALTEELRQARQQLAECQARPPFAEGVTTRR